MSYKRPIYLIFLLIPVLLSCVRQEPDLILISKDTKQRIEKWLSAVDPGIKFRECYSISPDSIDLFLIRADGIVIGGGEDVNPVLYGHPEYMDDCGEVNNYRDSLEIKLINFAIANDIPLLGICRGQQIINVAAGGTLIPDLPKYHPGEINHRSDKDSAHTITAGADTWLAPLTGTAPVWVNSRHHQSLDHVSEQFRVAAYAPDGVIESIEIRESEDHPFAVAVQWHPESLLDSLSMSIGQLFTSSIHN